MLLGRTFAERKLWRPALDACRFALDLREVADLRGNYEQLRDEHGFRMLDYSVDADAASPRACFQFSEDLPGKRTDFSPFVALEGNDKPAISAEEKQLCVEGLKHGERYSITLRAGLPSTVRETLQKSAEYNIYVRDRKPVRALHRQGLCAAAHRPARHSGGQRQYLAVKVQIHRIGDRNLIDTVLGGDFQRNIYRYERGRLGSEKGALVWKGDLEDRARCSTPTSPPLSRSIRRSAICSPASM